MSTITIAGNPITIYDANSGSPVSLFETVDGGQEGSGTPSWSNIRPLITHNTIELTTRNAASSTTLTINLNGQYYKGYFDFASKTFTATYRYIALTSDNFSSYNFALEPVGANTWFSNSGFLSAPDWTNPVKGNPPSTQVSSFAISNGAYPPTNHGNFFGAWWRAGNSLVGVGLLGPTSVCGSTISEFAAYIAANPQSAAYELATPVVIDLDFSPSDFTLFHGYNVISGSAGEITLEYEQGAMNISLPSGDWQASPSPAYPGQLVTLTYTGEGAVDSVVVVRTEGLVNVPVTKESDKTWSFTMPQGNVGVTASTREKYAVNILAGGGGYAEVVGASSVLEGDTCTIRCYPDDGFRVAGVTTDGPTVVQVSENLYSFTMPGNAVLVTVVFIEYDHANIIITQVTGGTIEADKYEAMNGDTITLTITTDPGYQFLRPQITKDGRTVNYTKVDDTTYTFVVTI